MKQFIDRFAALLASRRFFTTVMVFFVVETLWIALSSDFPMAFDEEVHLGIIKLYAHHWLPFLNGQGVEIDSFGAVFRDPSYLFHYLLSFPYRVLNLFIHGQTGLVIALRLINIALFGVGLWLFRRVLIRVKLPPMLINASLALFVLIPITPLLAGQINYDNLLFPLIALTCLLAFRVIEGLQRRELAIAPLLWLLAISLLASLVKYAFLPIFLAIFVFMVVVAWRHFGGLGREFWQESARSFMRLSKFAKIGLITLGVVSFGLFFQRYGVNVLRYHTPLPDCDAVLSVERCLAYGPWNRDYNLAKNTPDFTPQPLRYVAQWLFGMWRRLFFVITGPTHQYQNYPPLPLPSLTAAVLTIGGVLAIILWWRQTFRGRTLLALLCVISFTYLLVLFLKDYSAYAQTGKAVAVNGRYLLPILLPLAAVAGHAMSAGLKHRPRVQALILGAALLLFLNGGGVFSFIVRSNSQWYWPNQTVVDINNAAHNVLSPLTLGKGFVPRLNL